MRSAERFEINMGTETEPDWQPVPGVTDIEFGPDPAEDTEMLSTLQPWSATFTLKRTSPPPRLRDVRMARWQAWRKYAHRLGIVRSIICTIYGMPFGFRRHHR